MILVMLGPPGTGKGTVSQYLKEKRGFVHISTGDLIRSEIAKTTELGKKIQNIVAEGKLVDDEIVKELLENAIRTSGAENIVLDGFPRNVNQAKMLDKIVKDLGLRIDLVIDLETEDEVIVKRLSGRRQCIKCNRIYGIDVKPKKEGFCDYDNEPLIQRKDDREDVVRERLKIYRETTKPLVAYYNKRGLLKVVDGNKKLDLIFKEIDYLIDKTRK